MKEKLMFIPHFQSFPVDVIAGAELNTTNLGVGQSVV